MRTPARPLRDAKTVLQEWAQARGLPTPGLSRSRAQGSRPRSGVPRHGRAAGPRPAEGLGRSKRAAEQAAAAAMLTREGVKADRRDG